MGLNMLDASRFVEVGSAQYINVFCNVSTISDLYDSLKISLEIEKNKTNTYF